MAVVDAAARKSTRLVNEQRRFRDCVRATQAIIRTIHGSGGVGHEEFPFIKPVPASGNIEDWLTTLLHYMQLTVKALCATVLTQRLFLSMGRS